ncbi:MAG: hypothetical protein WA082_04825 [Candidatus Moraniibacteriota bacterium]
MDESQEAERRADERRMQLELFVLEGDKKRLEDKRDKAMIEMKRLKTAIEHLEIDRRSQETILTRMEQEIETLTEEMKQLKKKMVAR